MVSHVVVLLVTFFGTVGGEPRISKNHYCPGPADQFGQTPPQF